MRSNITLALLFYLLDMVPVTIADDAVFFSRDIRPILAENCWKCHGPDESAREADLRLDKFDSATGERDGNSAIVPGNPETGELIKRVTSLDSDMRMPPPSTGKSLSKAQIRMLESWIRSGAEYETHWSLKPIQAVVPPLDQGRAWSRSAIDRFIWTGLAQKNLSPSDSASKFTLIRRLYLDLIGILPAREHVDRFVADARPDAYEQLVERLLTSPHFGERWGRNWLDQARYADSHGYTNDDPRVMWPYRDWVISALNADLPFDLFTVEQLAGDLLPEPTQSQLIATGFHRNTLINTEGGVKADQFRDEQVKDRVDTTGLVWMGLTLGCAKCHSHKYDPIQQTEYYQIYAFFNSTEDNNSIAPTIRQADAQKTKEISGLEKQISELESSIKKDEESKEKSAANQARKDRLAKLKAQLKTFDQMYPQAMVLRELEQRRDTFVQQRGDFLRKAGRVKADTPRALPPLFDTTHQLSAESNSNAAYISTRRDLANWLMRTDHPLTARVRVNRIWMRLFGRGLVETEDDFGTQGTLPSHPKLLDWLARDFQKDWSTKRLLKTIVTSSVYRQSSKFRHDLAKTDPRNVLLGRQPRLRVEAEIVRDLALSASGFFNANIGGPSVYPPQPDGVYAFTQHKREWPTANDGQRYRRGMYTFFFRSAPHPFMSTFDVPKFNQTCTRRDRSNTPLQSLTVANDESMFEFAQGLAARVLMECKTPESNDTERLGQMFRICMVRPPLNTEIKRLEKYLHAERNRLANSEHAVWTSVARVVMNLDEFITRE